MQEIGKLLGQNLEFIERLIETLADKELDLELEFDEMKLDIEGMEITLSGKTTLSAITKNVES